VGFSITGVDEAESTGVTVFHAGTKVQQAHLVNSGGRVLGVTASGADLPTAITRAYAGVGKIKYDKSHFRTDIGQKGLKRYNNA
jgi:phosphoribosylamine--glycine ligase